MQLRKRLTVAATLLSLGGLTGVAMSSGTGRKRDQAAVPLADVRTVTTQQTIHRYRHIGGAGPSNGALVLGKGTSTVARAATAAVHTRASGSKAASRRVVVHATSPAVKSGPSGTHRTSATHRPSASKHDTTPKTRPSGSKGSNGHGSSGGGTSTTAGNPTTKPSGSSGETGTQTPTTPTPPPTTKPSGSPPGGESGGGTTTTPTPPTTKPSGSTEGSGSGGGTSGGGEHKDGGHGED